MFSYVFLVPLGCYATITTKGLHAELELFLVKFVFLLWSFILLIKCERFQTWGHKSDQHTQKNADIRLFSTATALCLKREGHAAFYYYYFFSVMDRTELLFFLTNICFLQALEKLLLQQAARQTMTDATTESKIFLEFPIHSQSF